MPAKILASLILGSTISGVFLWYSFRGVNLHDVWRGMRDVGTTWVAASVMIAILSLVIRAIRWRYLMAGGALVGSGSLLSATFIGFMANNMLPARIGEFVRAWVFARREVLPVPTVLASVLVERLLDVIAALAVLGLCLVVSPNLGGEATSILKGAGLVVMLVAIASGLILVVVIRYRRQLLGLLQRWTVRVRRPWAVRSLEVVGRFLDGLHIVRGWGQAGAVVGLSVFIWAAGIASFHLLAEGFGFGLTVVQTSLVFVIVLFGAALPSAPGYVGTFHGFCVGGLALVAGIEPTPAVAYATLLHGSQWLVFNAIGLGCLISDRSIGWPRLAELSAQRDNEAESIPSLRT